MQTRELRIKLGALEEAEKCQVGWINNDTKDHGFWCIEIIGKTKYAKIYYDSKGYCVEKVAHLGSWSNAEYYRNKNWEKVLEHLDEKELTIDMEKFPGLQQFITNAPTLEWRKRGFAEARIYN